MPAAVRGWAGECLNWETFAVERVSPQAAGNMPERGGRQGLESENHGSPRPDARCVPHQACQFTSREQYDGKRTLLQHRQYSVCIHRARQLTSCEQYAGENPQPQLPGTRGPPTRPGRMMAPLAQVLYSGAMGHGRAGRCVLKKYPSALTSSRGHITYIWNM